MNKTKRRNFLLAAPLLLSTPSCTNVSDMFGSRRTAGVTPRPDRMIRWVQNSGRDNMMSPEALSIMGLSRPNNMDIPVKQISQDGADGRYTLSLTGFRQIWEFIFHRRGHDDVLMFHHSNRNFGRLSSVRFPRNGRPLFITDAAFAENDFQKQIGFWFNVMPGR